MRPRLTNPNKSKYIEKRKKNRTLQKNKGKKAMDELYKAKRARIHTREGRERKRKRKRRKEEEEKEEEEKEKVKEKMALLWRRWI